MAKSIKQLKKHTNSLQSMMSMNANENNQPEVGKYLTEFCYTDRHSYLITEVDGNSFKTENGRSYIMTKKGVASPYQEIVYLKEILDQYTFPSTQLPKDIVEQIYNGELWPHTMTLTSRGSLKLTTMLEILRTLIGTAIFLYALYRFTNWVNSIPVDDVELDKFED
jgi:hypothetical protein